MIPRGDYGPGESLMLPRGNYDPGDECNCDEERFDPSQDRDDNGRWTAGAGGYKVHSISEAIARLGKGQGIQFERPHQVVTMLHRLNDIAKQAQAKGSKAPMYDLCKVSVPGTNLFCGDNLNIPRSGMPQLRGTPTAGTPADKLPRDDRGEVDVAEGFIASLRSQGLAVTQETEHADRLRASQRELDGTKVAGIMGALERGELKPSPIFISKENYIIDGHHRWAAYVGAGLEGLIDQMPVNRVDQAVLPTLKQAMDYAGQQGIQQEGVAAGYQKAARSLMRMEPPAYAMDIDLRYKED